MKDKTYYIVIDGKTVRVRASKKPSKDTQEALTAMVRIVQKGDYFKKADPKKFPK